MQQTKMHNIFLHGRNLIDVSAAMVMLVYGTKHILFPKGSYECIYNNMPRFGFGKAGELIPAKGNYHNAKDRAGVTVVTSSEKQTRKKWRLWKLVGCAKFELF